MKLTGRENQYKPRLGMRTLAAAAALAAAFSVSCTSHIVRPSGHQWPRPASVTQPARDEGGRAPRSQAFRERSALLSLWERGRCSLEGGRTLTYTDIINSGSASLRLDSDAQGASSILCSGQFTAVFQDARAIISIGGTGVLNHSQMLGMVGERFLSANSYEISLRPIIDEDGGISGRSMESGMLQVTSNSGRRWSIDLADPFRGWNVY